MQDKWSVRFSLFSVICEMKHAWWGQVTCNPTRFGSPGCLWPLHLLLSSCSLILSLALSVSLPLKQTFSFIALVFTTPLILPLLLSDPSVHFQDIWLDTWFMGSRVRPQQCVRLMARRRQPPVWLWMKGPACMSQMHLNNWIGLMLQKC